MKEKFLDRRSSRQKAPRDQSESAFARILTALVERVRGARGAVLVDADGEAVDYAGRVDPYTLRLAAAHWRIVLGEARRQPHLRTTLFFLVRAARGTFAVRSLPDGYAVALCLSPGVGLAASCRRPLAECARSIVEEAGWSTSEPEPWYRATVTTSPSGKPTAIATGTDVERLDVLGHLSSGLSLGERAWRVRYKSGREAILVREPGGLWYSDEPVIRSPSPEPPEPTAESPHEKKLASTLTKAASSALQSPSNPRPSGEKNTLSSR